MNNPQLDFLYKARTDERLPFGRAWCGPEKFDHGALTMIAQFLTDPQGDGQDVDIMARAQPARSYELIIHARDMPFGVTKTVPGYKIGFTDPASLPTIGHLARAICAGTVRVYNQPET
jgi:hypothetical protein